MARSILLIPLCSLLFACSFLSKSGPQTSVPPQPELPQVIEPEVVQESGPTSTNSEGGNLQPAIEVVWEIPNEPIDEYVIRYGTSNTNLERELRLKPNQISIITDSRFGKVYHYFITGFSPDKSLYLTVSAVNGGQESEPSKVFEIAPSKSR